MKFSPQKKKILAGFIILFLFVFLFYFFQRQVKSFIYTISMPIQKPFWQAGKSVSNFWETIIEIKNLKNEKDELELENQELTVKIIKLKELEKENKVLREALDINLQKDFKMILAEIISKDISQDYILIDRGLRDGVSKHMPVITQQKVLLGRIGEVYDNFSKVVLITNKESSFDVKIQEKDITGLAKGQGNLKIILDFISGDKEISEGDIVITDSLGGIFPKGLLVGNVKEPVKNDVEPFTKAKIESAFDINKLNFLFIIAEK